MFRAYGIVQQKYNYFAFIAFRKQRREIDDVPTGNIVLKADSLHSFPSHHS